MLGRSELEDSLLRTYTFAMATTVDQIVEEARRLSRDQIAELVDRLTESLTFEPEIEDAWKKEVRRRVAEIEKGEVKGVPGDEVSAHIRQIIGR
jgi:putative addiction module component (TIGR02574 family)